VHRLALGPVPDLGTHRQRIDQRGGQPTRRQPRPQQVQAAVQRQRRPAEQADQRLQTPVALQPVPGVVHHQRGRRVVGGQRRAQMGMKHLGRCPQGRTVARGQPEHA